jgi:predicted RNA-binding protein with PIN domain
MVLLIDGYNLLNVTDIFAAEGVGTELHRSRWALLEFLAAAISQRERARTTIVFDAAGAPPGLPSLVMHEGMTVRFARRHSDADELIEQLLEDCKAPKALMVVSSDHRIQRAARHHGAAYIDSEKWFAKLRAEQRARTTTDEVRAKPDCQSPEEVSYWVDQFATEEKEPKKRGRKK